MKVDNKYFSTCFSKIYYACIRNQAVSCVAGNLTNMQLTDTANIQIKNTYLTITHMGSISIQDYYLVLNRNRIHDILRHAWQRGDHTNFYARRTVRIDSDSRFLSQLYGTAFKQYTNFKFTTPSVPEKMGLTDRQANNK